MSADFSSLYNHHEREVFAAVLDAVDSHAAALENIRALFDQSWFPTLDAAVAYAIVRAYKPPRIVEVGSGHSTRFLSRAASDGGFQIGRAHV